MPKVTTTTSGSGGSGWVWLLLLLGVGAIGGGLWGLTSWLLGRSPALLTQARQARSTPSIPRLAETNQQLTQQINWLQLIPPWPLLPHDQAQAQLPTLKEQQSAINRELTIARGLNTAENAAMKAARLVQNPPHPPDVWQQAKQQWQLAIQTLASLPPDALTGAVIQSKLATYRSNLAAIEQQLAVAVQAVEFNNRGVEELNNERYREAIAWFQQALAHNPKMAEALLGQGLAQVALQDYRSALESFNRSITAKGDFVDPYLYRAETRYEFGDAAGAMADLDQAIALDNQRATAYLLRGVIHFAEDQANQARSDLNKAVELFSQQKDFDAATQARTLLAQLPAELPPAELPVTESAPPDNPAVALEDDDDDDDDYKRRRRLSLQDVRSTWDRVRRSGRRRR